MAGQGPPPKPDAQRRRRNATVAMTRLPAEGRTGPVPLWPLVADIGKQIMLAMAAAKVDELTEAIEDAAPRSRKSLKLQLDKATHQASVFQAEIEAQRLLEQELWAQLWATPQAVAWERLRYTREVAQYCRWKIRAEMGDLKASTEARQLADRLGLNPQSMLRLRWEIAPDEVAEQRATRTTRARKKPAPRLRAVDSGSAKAR